MSSQTCNHCQKPFDFRDGQKEKEERERKGRAGAEKSWKSNSPSCVGVAEKQVSTDWSVSKGQTD